jgi:hypothetical protein
LILSLPACQLVISIAVDQAASPINRGFLLLALLFVLLGGFLLGVLLLNISRRNRRKADEARRQTEREAQLKDQMDPWYEAGRRQDGRGASPADEGEPPQAASH